MLLSRLLPVLALSLLLPLEAAEFVRAFGTFPVDVSPRSIVAGPDGYFYGISGTGPTRAGATFRIASDWGKFEVTHQFPAPGSLPNFTVGGSQPDQLPLISKDGCVYGFAKHGGLYGHGVLFEVRPDRDFVVIDLDPSQLPPELNLVGETFVDSLSGLFEGEDRSFYSYHLAGALIRIGRDGVISKVAAVPHPGTAFLTFPDPLHTDRIFSVSTNLAGGESNRLHLLQIRLTDGAILKEVSSADFAANPNGVTALPSDHGLLVQVEEDSSAEVSSKLYRLEDSGAMTELATFGWQDNPALPPPMNQFIHAATDGTLYYSTSSQRTGSISVPDGRTLIELKPDGSFRTICGFGDHPMFNMVEKDGYLYGATYGTEVYLPKNQAGYQEEWMSLENAANHEIVKGKKSGGFWFQVALTDPELLNAAPVLNPDLFQLRRYGRDGITVGPVSNDRDPERRGVQLEWVDEPSRGSGFWSGKRATFFVLDQGRTSTMASYRAIDKDSKVSTGIILMRGNPQNYWDQGMLVRGRPLKIEIKLKGTFNAKVPTGSGDETVTVSGRLDWYDQGLAGVRLASGEVVTLHFAIRGGRGVQKLADYRIRQGNGTTITGAAEEFFGRR